MPCYRISVAFNIDVRNNADVEALVEAFRLMPEVVGVERREDELAIATISGPARALLTEGAVLIEGRMASAMEKQLRQCFAAATQAALLRRRGFTVSMRREAGKLRMKASDRGMVRW